MKAIIDTRQINVLYDISVLGLGHHYPHSKTGVFRVVENIAYGLRDSEEINLSFCETQFVGVINAGKNYLLSHSEFQEIPFANFDINSQFILEHEILREANIFHSGFHQIPNQLKQTKNIKNFLTIHDLIPVLRPHLFRGVNDPDYYRMWRSLNSLDIEDYVICVSHATRNDLLNNVKLDPAKVFVVHNAASPDIFYPCSNITKIASVRHKYSIPDYPYILGLSTLEPRKNIDHVIRCFAKLVQEQSIKDLNLVLVGGKGWNYNKIFEEIENHATLKERIIFTGYVADEDLAALYSGALAFVYMSFYEGFGLPPLEAMQCGVPVVTSNTSSFPEVVGDAGVILDPKDVDGFCNSIFEIYKKPSLREAMSLASLEQAKNFSWEKCIQETIAVYKTALSDEDLSVGEARVYSTKKDLFIPDSSKINLLSLVRSNIKIIVDGVFFQLYNTGIARVWKSLLEEWVANGFAKNIVVLDREGLNTVGTVPRMPGIQYRLVPTYDYRDTDADREMLQQVCDEEGADLFISSYYTTPLSTPSVFLAHDMIPELMGADPNHPMWREKHYGIQNASACIAVSENTARDLVKFFPHICLESVTVAQNGVDHQTFSPASSKNINRFKTKYGILKPYFILVGAGGGYKNTILFFKAFAQLYTKQGFEIVCTGSGSLLPTEFRNYTSGNVVHMLQLSDDELSIAYSGAVALVYPSVYEGFGLPVLEAIACGCPLITCPNASIPEVAGEAALYVNDDNVDGLADALCEVQKPNVRNSLIATGLEQAKKFSWSKMARTVSSALIDATLLPLNLKDINLIIFPDWLQPEESLCFELEQVIKAIATHPDNNQMTLLVNTANTPEEEAALVLSSVSMNLLLQEDLDVPEGLEISLVGQFSEIQWKALLPRIQARIVLENENQEAITAAKVETLPSCCLDSLSNRSFSVTVAAVEMNKLPLGKADFIIKFHEALEDCTWEPHSVYSVFTQYDRSYYLKQKDAFLHKYRCFYAISKTISPKKIIEFGTSAGSSADAYLSASPNAEYIGIDIFGEGIREDDGTPWKPYEIAHELFQAKGFRNYKLIKADLRTLTKLPYSSDFVVIDAAHDFENEYNNLKLALTANPSFIFIDDVDGSETQLAIEEALRSDLKSKVDYTLPVDYVGGGLVIKLKKQIYNTALTTT